VSTHRHLGAGAALSVVARGGPLLAGAVLSIVLARTIGPPGNGRYVLLLTLVGLTSMIVSLGLLGILGGSASSCSHTIRSSERSRRANLARRRFARSG
jgi:hypothetical protein